MVQKGHMPSECKWKVFVSTNDNAMPKTLWIINEAALKPTKKGKIWYVGVFHLISNCCGLALTLVYPSQCKWYKWSNIPMRETVENNTFSFNEMTWELIICKGCISSKENVCKSQCKIENNKDLEGGTEHLMKKF